MYTINFKISKNAQDAEYIATGVRSFGDNRKLEYADTDLTPAQRAILVQAQKFEPFSATLSTYEFVAPYISTGLWRRVVPSAEKRKPITFEKLPALEEVFAILSTMVAQRAAVVAQMEAARPEFDKLTTELKAIQEAEKVSSDAKRKLELAASTRSTARHGATIYRWSICTFARFTAKGMPSAPR